MEFLKIIFLRKKSLEPRVNLQLIVGVRMRLSRRQSDSHNQNLKFLSRSRPEADPGFLFVVEPQSNSHMERTQFKVEDRVASEVALVASLKVAFLSSPMNSSNFR